MRTKRATRVLLSSLFVMAAGCGTLTEPKPLLDEFAWQAVSNPDDVQEGVDIVGFFGDINFVGQLKTPTLCYNIGAKFTSDGSDLIVNVTATSTNSTACAQTPGGFSYSGAIRNLSSGTYTVHLIHTVNGQAPQEFTKTVKL